MASTEAENKTTPLFTHVTENERRPMRFWLSQNVPGRENYKKDIMKYGGELVYVEKHADVMLVDHLKKNLPPGCFSYKYVDHSIANGRLPEGQDLEKYRAGPSAPRPMGASHIPRKATRTEFSLKDDQTVYDWLRPLELEGAPVSGTKIYQDLAEKFPGHSWQAWRGRYLRRLRGNPRPGGELPRPDLLPAAAPEPKRNHLQQLPLTTAKSRQTMSSPDPSVKRKRQSSPQTPIEAAAASPSKKMKREISKTSTIVVQRSPSDHPQSPSRTPNPETPSQVIPPTQHPHTIIHSTQSSPHTQPMHRLVLESSEETQDQPDPLFLELPFLPPSPEPDDDEESDEEDLPDVDGWIARQLARGITDEATIIDVLRSATMDQDLADKVLENWDLSTSIPDNVRGIWTAEDDKCLEATDGRDVERVITKHGEGFTNTRWEYLRMARERGLL